MDNDFSKTSSLTLTFDQVSLYKYGSSSLPNKFCHSQAKGQKILTGQIFFKDQQFDIDFWPRNLEINRGHQTPRVIYCTQFSNIQADIERTSLGLQTDRLYDGQRGAKQFAPLFFRGGHSKSAVRLQIKMAQNMTLISSL